MSDTPHLTPQQVIDLYSGKNSATGSGTQKSPNGARDTEKDEGIQYLDPGRPRASSGLRYRHLMGYGFPILR